ncbi:taf11 [Ecytonucleospora hepatopenaei]|uniref:Taf11 n=1 Tax=Ecytonucleospora hepatopenaei TaxID=646526 RepID=A0A1W0E361_9MICR|nr:taf11 [Ecytonucleospora hepatopenaei]
MKESKKSNVEKDELSMETTESNENLSSEEYAYKQKVDNFVQKTVADMHPEDQQRYETFRRSNFIKGAVKKYINQVIGQAVNPNMVIGVSGLAKVFVGELVTEGLKVQKEFGNTGPLLPIHIHEAMRRLQKTMPNSSLRTKSPWSTDI